MADKEDVPDMTDWSEQDKKAYERFGRRPKKTAHMARVLGGKEKQHFDSADYELQKGKGGKPTAVAGHPLGIKKTPIPDSVRNAQ